MAAMMHFLFLKFWNAIEWEMLHIQSWVLKPEYQCDLRTSSTNTSTGPSSTSTESSSTSTSTSTTKIVLEYEYFEYFAQLWNQDYRISTNFISAKCIHTDLLFILLFIMERE
jgi:hypothetical protein